jgi:serine/threonine protein kinase
MPQLSTPDILHAALEIPNPKERAAYLDEACANHPSLREEVESLITAHFADDAFMSSVSTPLWGEREGDTIGRYQLLRKLGEGGFGTVFLAEQNQPVKRRIALKLIKPGMDSAEIISRFQAERQALAMMDHPHIAKVHDAGTTESGRPYFVMELVDGVPINKHCANLITTERLVLFTHVCAAVQHAHQKGIIHRDLKPSNILVASRDGENVVKVIDFGIAKIVAAGYRTDDDPRRSQTAAAWIGTPQYMSPEQAELIATNVDTRSDIYSLGVILYELLTGTTPLDEQQVKNAGYAEMQRLIRDVTPPKPSTRPHPGVSPRALRGDLDWIVLKALEKDPARRYESAGALAEDVRCFLQQKPVEARPPSWIYLMQRFTRRHRGPVFASIALLLTLLLGAVGTTISMKHALDAKQELQTKNTELVDYKERLSGLLATNQNMLSEIRRMSSDEAQLPAEFEALQKQNQTLLDKVKNEVANQQRYAQQIEKLQQANSRLEQLVIASKDSEAAVELARAALFSDHIISLTVSDRGQFYLNGNLIPYPTLLKAFSTPPEDKGKPMQRFLKVTLPEGAKPTDDVFHYRLKQLATAAEQIGIRHEVFPQKEK